MASDDDYDDDDTSTSTCLQLGYAQQNTPVTKSYLPEISEI
jgi:hypothetical protein